MVLAPHNENTKQPISTIEDYGLNLKTPKLPPSLTFYDIWSKIPNPNVKVFLNKICFWTLVPCAEKWHRAQLDSIAVSTL